MRVVRKSDSEFFDSALETHEQLLERHQEMVQRAEETHEAVCQQVLEHHESEMKEKAEGKHGQRWLKKFGFSPKPEPEPEPELPEFAAPPDPPPFEHPEPPVFNAERIEEPESPDPDSLVYMEPPEPWEYVETPDGTVRALPGMYKVVAEDGTVVHVVTSDDLERLYGRL